ncbi:hypothetical protein ACH4YN_39475 [Streptomyces griseofuscus]|uniref:hypothetical protein n=1 Tax=Streptomyces griseofuscus TaxID=146922 RepID=UPI00379BFB5E
MRGIAGAMHSIGCPWCGSGLLRAVRLLAVLAHRVRLLGIVAVGVAVHTKVMAGHEEMCPAITDREHGSVRMPRLR